MGFGAEYTSRSSSSRHGSALGRIFGTLSDARPPNVLRL
jgi:hypothetical protein